MSKQSGYKKIKIDLTEHEIAVIAMMAHKKDITFNQMCIIILEEYIKELRERSNIKNPTTDRRKTSGKDNIRKRVR
jgi:hypothetical protein